MDIKCKNTQWYIYTKKADFRGLAEKYHISPVLARILTNRDIGEDEFEGFLYGDAGSMHDPHRLKNIDRAADLIRLAVICGKRIRIVGDYDVDGVSSTYILIHALQDLGADVSYEIPDRVKDGYGINERIIDEAHADGINLILTCDNGISAVEAIAKAKSYGMQVVVTDHHEIPKDENGDEILPPADVIVNPHQHDDGYPFKEICGGMVAYKLAQVLGTDPDISFAAIATVGDVMPLKDENRMAVKAGISSIADSKNKGLSKLIEVCGLNPDMITAYSIGFVIGPCINAAGRLESAKTALELFLTDDDLRATELAVKLKDLNDRRKAMTEAAVEASGSLIDDRDIQVIYLPECHESVAGIVAGRIKEALNHPAVVLTNKGLLKGSARSIENYNIFEHLCEVKDILERFGGHKLAAGLSIKEENLELLRERLNRDTGLTEKDFIAKIWIDTVLPFGALSVGLVNELSMLEPFGQGNEKPVFALKNVRIISARVMGKTHNVVKMLLKDEDGYTADGVIFGDGDAILSELSLAPEHKFDILYYPQLNDFNDNCSIQVVVKGWKI